MHSSSSASSFSIGAIVQYVFLAGIAYVLAGAPLLSILSSYSGRDDATDASARTVSPEKMENLVFPDMNLSCKEHAYKGVFVLSREPLVVYIEGFLSTEEARRIVEMSEPHFTPSTIWTAGQERLDTRIRHSEKASLPRAQTVKCIEDRARTFQGWRPHTFIEKLWSQRYGVGGHYTYHYDWSSATRNSGRVSSFMVYLETNCTGGGTHFPRLKRPSGQEWCRFIECDGEAEALLEGNASEHADLREGIIFKPVQGNAVYWENMRSDGSGYEESWHAGLPVKSGRKIGLNIWSWYQKGFVPHTQQEEGGTETR